MTIFEALRSDHEIQRNLLEQLTTAEGHSGQREQLLKETRDALVHHENAEEHHFYIPLMESDSTQEQARHSIAEHEGIDEALETLENTETSSPEWMTRAKKLRELVVHHLDEEEQQVFQKAEKVLTEKETHELGSQYRDEMKAQAGQE